MNAWKYPEAEDVYFAFGPMWYDGRRAPTISDMMEVQLGVSRDGIDWPRPWRQALIAPGAPHMRVSGEVWPIPQPIIRNDEVWLYYFSRPETHRTKTYEKNSGVIARAIWWLDRFIGAGADEGDGEFVTPPILFDGNRLSVNVNAGASGRLRVAIERPDGEPIPGYALADAFPVLGNGIALVPRWQHGPDVEALKGQPVRLRFVLRGADLYSIQFTAEQGDARRART
jgi:hypothetical protein